MIRVRGQDGGRWDKIKRAPAARGLSGPLEGETQELALGILLTFPSECSLGNQGPGCSVGAMREVDQMGSICAKLLLLVLKFRITQL